MICYLIERSSAGIEYVGSIAMLASKRWFPRPHGAIKFADAGSALAVARELMLSDFQIVEHQFGTPKENR